MLSRKIPGIFRESLAKYKELVEGIKANFKHVWEDKTYCEYAPEIRHNWVAAW